MVSQYTFGGCVVAQAAQIYGGISAGADALRGAVRMREENLRVAGVQTESKRTSLALACLLHLRVGRSRLKGSRLHHWALNGEGELSARPSRYGYWRVGFYASARDMQVFDGLLVAS